MIVVNRNARRTAHELDRLHERFRAHAVPVAAFHVASSSTDLHLHVKRAVKAGAATVVVGGGDGTMAHAVDALAHRDTALGVLPLGTGNSFAQSIGLDPHDIEAAVAVIARGLTRRIDLGCVNGTYFANFATIGLSSEIAGSTPTAIKRWSGTLAYALAAVRPLLSHRAFRARVRWKGGRLDLRTQDVIIANGRFFGTTPVDPEATIVDGRLTLYTTDDRSRIGALRTYVAFGAHDQTKLQHAHIVNATKFTIRARPKQTISVDGSLLEKTPARFSVARKALRVFVPEHGVARE